MMALAAATALFIVWREIGVLRPLAGIIAFVVFFTVHSSLFGARPY